MKKNIIYNFLWVNVIIFSVCLSGCKNRNASQEKDRIEKVFAKSEIQGHVKDFLYPLPTPLEAVQLLQDIGISYIIGISNYPENINQYLSAKSKAVALGVYGTDLSYAGIYNMQQDLILYLEAIKNLAQELDLQSVYNEDLLMQVKHNIDIKDTLVNVLSNALFESYTSLNQNGKGNLALLMVAGGWIEALYLTTHVSENCYNNYELVKIIFDQKSSLNKFFDILNEKNDHPSIQELADILMPLRKTYDSIQGSLTEDQLKKIVTEAEKARNNLLQ